ncbi:MAG: hypothetical protein NT016_03450 [Candidatus Aenigmarchaeota archaeon]|nr:hypothetical protein [Candidatus Aenigmarchaeota archaeon]
MAKKRAVRREKRFGKTENEWREWGEEFGDSMAAIFGGVRTSARRAADKERDARRAERREVRWEWHEHWHHGGVVGPIIAAVFKMVFFAIGAWLLGLFGSWAGSGFIIALGQLFMQNMPLFFISFLLSSYARASRCCGGACKLVWPAIHAASVSAGVWIFALLIDFVNSYTVVALLQVASEFLRANIAGIFLLAAFISYLYALSRKDECEGCCDCRRF